ncbi:hypothetical protein LJR045_002392 [Microbacterium sp. LjRoot45]|uniref:hypothetical protein n=1 Tax=Microbacterium sp. LjRoot45 TaxID=3342329 RepID=UPI003ECEEE42
MTEELEISDRVYFGIASLKGWDSALNDAAQIADNFRWRLGVLLSTILVASDGGGEPVTVAGDFDDDRTGTGFIALFYPEWVVLARVEELSATGGTTTVTVHRLSDVRVVSIRTEHMYFDGTERSPRHRGVSFTVSIEGDEFDVTSISRTANGSPLRHPDAVLAAFKLIRDAKQ